MSEVKRPAPVSKDLYLELKARCAKRDELLSDALEEAIRRYLEEEE